MEPGDGLVIWNHELALAPVEPNPDLGPLAEVQLSEGYAVAASSYSQSGWALFSSAEDLTLFAGPIGPVSGRNFDRPGA